VLLRTIEINIIKKILLKMNTMNAAEVGGIQAGAAARQTSVKPQLSRLCFYDILYANGKRGNGGHGLLYYISI